MGTRLAWGGVPVASLIGQSSIHVTNGCHRTTKSTRRKSCVANMVAQLKNRKFLFDHYCNLDDDYHGSGGLYSLQMR